MHKPKVVALSPDKENITYHVGTFSSISETFHSVLKKLSIERTNFPRMIIYTRSFVICADIFMYFQKGLGESITDPVDAPNLSEFRLVDMYTQRGRTITERYYSESVYPGIAIEDRCCHSGIWHGCGLCECTTNYTCWASR